MNLQQNYRPSWGYTEVIRPEKGGLGYLSLGMLRLKAGRSYRANTGDSEFGFIIIYGSCDFEAGGRQFRNVGRRKDFFSGKATSVYVPPKTDVEIKALTEIEIAAGSIPASKGGPAALIRPKDTIPAVFGKGICRRRVNFLIFEDQVEAERLIVGETYHTPGGWSGFPPHKHDVDRLPQESANEEIYLVKCHPPQGFGLATVYDDKNLNNAYRLTNNSVLGIPGGYHPMVSTPGYKFGFIWFMGGRKRPWRPVYDPANEWLIEWGKRKK